ncbi:hypothetical protein O9929_15880 [Vibrio lentus]|nr:hypothetical protein [Vibrio lentus]
MILVDLDHFGFGLAVYMGIQKVTLLCAPSARYSMPVFITIKETFCRIGGEEFMLLMIGTHHSETKQRRRSRSENALKRRRILHCESSTSQYLTASVSCFNHL